MSNFCSGRVPIHVQPSSIELWRWSFSWMSRICPGTAEWQLSPVLLDTGHVHSWSSCSVGFEISGQIRSFFGVPLVGCVRAEVFAFADITDFVSRRLDIEDVKKAVARYEQVAGAKVNFDKSKSLRWDSWRGGVPLPGPFRWSDGSVRILGVWFRPPSKLGTFGVLKHQASKAPVF